VNKSPSNTRYNLDNLKEIIDQKIDLEAIAEIFKYGLEVVKCNKNVTSLVKISNLHSQAYLDIIEIASICNLLFHNKTLMSHAVNKKSYLLKYCPEEFKDDEYLIKQALMATKQGIVLRHASKRLRDDFDFALFAMQRDHRSFKFISKRLKDSENFLKKAMAINPCIYKYFKPKTKNETMKFLFTRYVATLNYIPLRKIERKFFSLIDPACLRKKEAAFIYESVTFGSSKNIFEDAELRKIICGDLDVSEETAYALSDIKTIEEGIPF